MKLMPKYQSLDRWLGRWMVRNGRLALSNYPTISRFARGFSLVELLLSLFFISTLVLILTASAGALKTRFVTDKHVSANRLASKEIERLRNVDFNNLPGPTQTWPPVYLDDNDYLNLKKGASTDPNFSYNISNYGGAAGDPRIKQVNVTIIWYNENGINSSTTYETLISQSGL